MNLKPPPPAEHTLQVAVDDNPTITVYYKLDDGMIVSTDAGPVSGLPPYVRERVVRAVMEDIEVRTTARTFIDKNEGLLKRLED